MSSRVREARGREEGRERGREGGRKGEREEAGKEEVKLSNGEYVYMEQQLK